MSLAAGRSPHRAWIEVDHAALAAQPGRRCGASPESRCSVIAVVKANAYGHGAIEVSRTLLDHGVERLAVATLGEGLSCGRRGSARRSWSSGRWAPPRPSGPSPQTWSRWSTTRRGSSCSSGAAAAAGRRAAVQLKIDSGLGRQGSEPGLAVELALRIVRSPHLRLAGTFSHLAVPGEDEAYTDVQVLRLAQALDAMRSAGADPGLVHLAATGGVLAGSGTFGDAIRPGLGLYGMVPGWAADRDPGLRPVLSLHALPLRIFPLAAGEAIGYGLRFRAERATRIATLGIGYGDGWPRAHANNGWVLVRGVRRPVVGAVSMDGITVDLGDLDDVTYADEFVLIGEQMGARIDADEVAAQRRTINYEVTTALRDRLPRVHLPEAAANAG